MRRLLVLVLVTMLVVVVTCAPMVAIAQEATPDFGAVALDRTDTRYFLPFGGQGLNAGLTVKEDTSGACTAESLALPHRPDAWDCIDDGDQIYDPCFENPFAGDDAPVELVCGAAPYENEVILLTVDEPLRRDKEGPPTEPSSDRGTCPGPSSWPMATAASSTTPPAPCWPARPSITPARTAA